jgi:hypothetical protein
VKILRSFFPGRKSFKFFHLDKLLLTLESFGLSGVFYKVLPATHN